MLSTEQEKQDLGKLKFGRPKAFSYEVKNLSDTPLEITKISVGCTSCTTANTTKTKLGAGETTTINVVFTPGSIGTHKKHVNVEWNKSKILKLEFTAESYA